MSTLPAADLRHVLTHTEALWRNLAGERLFITGGSGFFGIWLLEALASANDHFKLGLRATVLTRDPQRVQARWPHLAGTVDWLRGDVRDFRFPAGQFSHVVHAATSVDARFNAAAPVEALDTMVAGTRRVLDFAAQAGTVNLLLTSSGAIYGPQPGTLERIPEDYPGGPDVTRTASVYAEGKRVAELLLAMAADSTALQAKIARCFCFVGPHLPLDWHFAIGNFIGDALAGRDLIVQGDGRPLRSYMHAADLVIWLLTILVSGVSMRPYNVGSEEACSIAELAARVAGIAGTPGQVRVLTAEGGGLAPRYIPDTSRARNELGLELTIPLDVAITSTLDWWRSRK